MWREGSGLWKGLKCERQSCLEMPEVNWIREQEKSLKLSSEPEETGVGGAQGGAVEPQLRSHSGFGCADTPAATLCSGTRKLSWVSRPRLLLQPRLRGVTSMVSAVRLGLVFLQRQGCSRTSPLLLFYCLKGSG